jgi:asparagine synthase (glutamine-hydrolysing)
MCGLAGFINYKGDYDEDILVKMRDALIHRGPDDAGHQIFNDGHASVGLAHRRLSIIDLSTSGRQPMTDESGNFCIIFNGEIYNHKEIRIKLEGIGHKFHSFCDTEVILRSYIQWGIKAVDLFIGMFAFVIYDRKQNKVIFCRDRVGVKPLYYSIYPELILFGSELKSLMAHPGFKREIDNGSLELFFKHAWIGAPHSIFTNTFKVKAGHYITINLNTKKVDEHCYWDVDDYYNQTKLNFSFDEAKERLHLLLKSACEYRMVSDTEVGIFLSGGIDSSTVAAILQSDRTDKINTFSIGFQEEEFNEAPYAKAVAKFLGTNHHETFCTIQDALEIIPRLPFFYDEPFADSSAIPTMLVSKLASSKVKVSLSADGGDEVFGGYPRYYYKLDDFNRVKRIPYILRNPLAGILKLSLNFNATRNPLHQVRLEKLYKTLSAKQSVQMFRYRSEPLHFSEREISKLLLHSNTRSFNTTFYDSRNLNNSMDPSMFMMALEYKTILSDDLLTKVDRATMSYSLEGREPLLDHRLVEFSSRLPAQFHYNDKKMKFLLREICYEYLPQNIMDRPKKGFAIPTDKWLHNELKEMILDFSSPKFIKKQNLFNFTQVETMVSNYYKGFDHNGERLWIFLMFQNWYDQWMK